MDMNTNVKAVNAFDEGHDASALLDCEYIEGSSIPNQLAGAFWAYLASLLIIFQMIFLGLSEVGWNMAFFDRYFPVLGSNFGLGILGVFQCLISTQILSHFVGDFTLISAFFLFVLGCLNILLGLIFRESAKVKRSINFKLNLSSWRIWRPKIKGTNSLGAPRDMRLVFANNLNNSTSTVFSSRGEKARSIISMY